jgi:hypothetical protein
MEWLFLFSLVAASCGAAEVRATCSDVSQRVVLEEAAGVEHTFSYSINSSDVSAMRVCSWTFDASAGSVGPHRYISLRDFRVLLGSGLSITSKPFLQFVDTEGELISTFRSEAALVEFSLLPQVFTINMFAAVATAGSSVSFSLCFVADESTSYALGCPTAATVVGERFVVSTDVDGFGLLPMGDNAECRWMLVCRARRAVMIANISVTSEMKTHKFVNHEISSHMFPVSVRAVGLSVGGGMTIVAVCVSGTLSASHTITLVPVRSSSPRPTPLRPTTGASLTVRPASFPTTTAEETTSTSSAPPETTTQVPTLQSSAEITSPITTTTPQRRNSVIPTAAPSTDSPITGAPHINLCCLLEMALVRDGILYFWSSPVSCSAQSLSCAWVINSSSTCGSLQTLLVNATLGTASEGYGTLGVGSSVVDCSGSQLCTTKVNATLSHASRIDVRLNASGQASIGIFAQCFDADLEHSSHGASSFSPAAGLFGFSFVGWSVIALVFFVVAGLLFVCTRRRKTKVRLDVAVVAPQQDFPALRQPLLDSSVLDSSVLDSSVRHGADTWLQHAEDVVAELNQCQLYNHIDKDQEEDRPAASSLRLGSGLLPPPTATARVLRLIEMSDSDFEEL